ncbi:MAG: Unknown protein [uncultured Sulfurovum sp.]|uniref:Peptidoglycan binding-like domain-containing protein n=1 Tax=uncultured Sulfurovum sp. TaxID=269237 RepID=A0A6S6T0N8_9BACT|nr:MAG: Unknown protein [uncultured Sulfurovum sp.]
MSNYKLNETGTHVKELQNELVLLDVKIDKKELDSQKYGATTVRAINDLQEKHGLAVTSEVDKDTLKHIKALAKKENERTINGRILTRGGLPASNMIVEVLDKSIGEIVSLTEKEIRTDAKGYYEIVYTKAELLERKKRNADIEVRVLDEKDKKVMAHSSIVFNAGIMTNVNIEINDELVKQPSQLELLEENIVKEVGSTLNYAELKEEDISFVSQKTGVEIATLNKLVTANKYAKEEEISASLFMALFAVGFPTELNKIYSISPKIIKKIWDETIEKKLIPHLTSAELEESLNVFKGKNIEFLLLEKNKIGVSSLHEVLSLTMSRGEQEYFLKESQDEEVELDDSLKLISELGTLTQYNALLMKEIKLVSKKELTLKGYFRKEKWLKVFGDNNTIKIPENMEKEEYAQSMALALKLEYANEAMAVELQDKQLIDKEIFNLMTVNHGFRLGEESFKSFQMRNKVLDTSVIDTKKVETLHRQISMSPTIEMIPILNKLGIDSAYKITKMSQKQFDTLGATKLSEKENELFVKEAKVIKSNAEKINKANTFLLASDMAYKAQPSVSTILPTLENLFGELDFCNCGHCSSVLSPAAYMVELLSFLDTDKNDDGKTAQDVLLEKRPDLEYLELTCENTETILPYIDVVNEILEYYADNITIDKYEGHNSSIDKDVEMVQHKIYIEMLNKEVYPLTLPFDRELETKRAYFQELKVPLYQVMKLVGEQEEIINREYLNLSDTEYDVFTKNEKIEALFGGKTVDELKNAKTLAKTLNLSYMDLEKILETQFFKVNISLKGKGCDFSQYTIENSNQKMLLKILRFVRLMNKMQWSIEETDKVFIILYSENLPTSQPILKEAFKLLLQNIVTLKHILEIDKNNTMESLLDILNEEVIFEKTLISFLNISEDDFRLIKNFKEITSSVTISEKLIVTKECMDLIAFIKSSHLSMEDLAYLVNKDDASHDENLLELNKEINKEVEKIETKYDINSLLSIEQNSKLVGKDYIVIYTQSNENLADELLDYDENLIYNHQEKQIYYHGILNEEKKTRLIEKSESDELKKAIETIYKLRREKLLFILQNLKEKEKNITLYTLLANSINTEPIIISQLISKDEIKSFLSNTSRKEMYIRLLKASFIIEKLKISSEELAVVIEKELFNFKVLTKENIDALLRLLAIRKINAITHDYKIKDFKSLIENDNLNTWQKLNAYFVKKKALQMMNTSEDELKSWYRDYKKIKFNSTKNLEIITDKLRNKRRDALVDYILHEHKTSTETHLNKMNTADKLFEYFLIDVQMNACMKTSRIKQAILTIQLFIDRCLLNLEEGVLPNEINTERWKWMKKYRLWEANRKVFLYPENWLEPELRTDKTPFFKEFETELLQSDLNDDLAEKALIHYLEKLDSIAKPEISAMFQEKDVLHVVGKMNNQFYYRRQEYGRWTAWEKINLKIEDNPLILVVWKGRLFIFWLNILKSSATKDDFSCSEDKPIPQEKIEVNISWSEYYNEKWQTMLSSDINYKQEEKEFIFDRDIFNKKDLLLRSSIDKNNVLYIQMKYNTKKLKQIEMNKLVSLISHTNCMINYYNTWISKENNNNRQEIYNQEISKLNTLSEENIKKIKKLNEDLRIKAKNALKTKEDFYNKIEINRELFYKYRTRLKELEEKILLTRIISFKNKYTAEFNFLEKNSFYSKINKKTLFRNLTPNGRIVEASHSPLENLQSKKCSSSIANSFFYSDEYSTYFIEKCFLVKVPIIFDREELRKLEEWEFMRMRHSLMEKRKLSPFPNKLEEVINWNPINEFISFDNINFSNIKLDKVFESQILEVEPLANTDIRIGIVPRINEDYIPHIGGRQ